MSDNKQHGVGYTVSLCGVMSALALALMFMMGMVPSFEYISPAIGGILIWVVRKNLSIKYGLVSYIAVSVLALFVVPNYEATMMFILLLGYYPIIREFLQKIKPKVLRLAVKVLIYAGASVLAYTLLIRLFGMDYLEDTTFGKYTSLILLGMGGLVFIMYDFFLGLFDPIYDRVIKPKIQKRLK